MKVHHLNCGSMHPRSIAHGLVCHVLLIETNNGLVLVDSGVGLHDIADPAHRFGPSRFLVRPAFNESEAAIKQVSALGFNPQDVRHIILTHFDYDHTGGIADFPWAQIHLTSQESLAAAAPRNRIERSRYLPAQSAHHPTLITHTPNLTESWRGFSGIKELTEISSDIVLIDLSGHTQGHAAVAVNAGDRWVFHAGDSFYHHRQITENAGRSPLSLRIMERLIADDWAKVQENHRRLRELAVSNEADVLVVNAHDPLLLDRARSQINNHK